MTTTHPAQLNGGVWTSWLPVTTAWPTQAACATEIWARYGIQLSNDFWPYIYDPGYAQTVASPATYCLPPEATSWWEGGSTVSNTITSYSIGPIVCPAAYTTYSTILLSSSSTSIICCPRCVFVPQVPLPNISPRLTNSARTVTTLSPAISLQTVVSTVSVPRP
jgi:hypothetical protein